MLMDSINIKSFEREDHANVKTFAEEINMLDKLELSIPDRLFEYILSEQHLRENVLLAYHKQKLIAFAACIFSLKDSKEASMELIVHPQYRNRGIGRILYNIILNNAKSYKLQTATAFAKESMEASPRFLERRGFKRQKYMWKMDCVMTDVQYKDLTQEKFVTRRISNEDISIYVDIMNAGFKNDGDVMYNERSFQSLLGNPDEHVFFIECQRDIIATAAVGLQKDIGRGYIHNVTVKKEYRKKGYGELALRHCLNLVKEANLYKATLNVDGQNSNALHLYKKAGFVEVDTDVMFKLELYNI